MATDPVHRGTISWLLDRICAWFVKLPPEECNYSVAAVEIPMHDGIILKADLYRPVGIDPTGTVLAVGPYGRSTPMALGTVRLFAARGYQGLLVSNRGTFGSGGLFEPGQTDTADAQSIVSWMRMQPWYTGSFATLGNSFLGVTQWALLEQQPSDMVAAIISVAPHDISRVVWETGAFNLRVITWAELIAKSEDTNPVLWPSQVSTCHQRLREFFMATHQSAVVDKFVPKKTPWLRDMIERPDLSDPYWRPTQHFGAVERANLPILLVTGWQDPFFSQTMEQYRCLHKRGVKVALTVGPWDHGDVLRGDLLRETFEWLQLHFDRTREMKRKSAVRIYVGGACEWRNLHSWPPETTMRELYLRSAERLSGEKPSEREGESRFTFNPQHPTPAIGGPCLAHPGSCVDSAFAARSDALRFDTAKLEEDVEVTGKCHVELSHASGSRYSDLFVRISDVDQQGVSRNVTEVYRRLSQSDDPVRLSLPDCAHRFARGHSIRLIVAGGCYPHYACSPGIDMKTSKSPGTRPTVHVIKHGGKNISKLALPVRMVGRP